MRHLQKAEKWLKSHELEVDAIDIVAAHRRRRSSEILEILWAAPSEVFNTSGQSYRNGNFKEKLKSMSDDEAPNALAADGKLIKRPLLVNPDRVLVGFKRQTTLSAALVG